MIILPNTKNKFSFNKLITNEPFNKIHSSLHCYSLIILTPDKARELAGKTAQLLLINESTSSYYLRVIKDCC